MAKRKQKIVLEGFSFSVGKLIIEQEAEEFDHDELSTNVRNAIGQVVSAPARLLSAEATETPASQSSPTVEAAAKPRKRRRRSSKSSQGSETTDNGERTSRTKGDSPRGLIEGLLEHGFFAQERTIGEIREELHMGGHNFKSNQLSPGLLSLTQKKILSRRKDDQANWVYHAS